MAKQKKGWYYSPPKSSTYLKLTPSFKEKMEKDIAPFLKEFENARLSHKPSHPLITIQKIYTKWYKNFLYLCALYEDKREDVIRPTFENKYARIEFLKEEKHNLAYFRHTGKWWTTEYEITLKKALSEIKTNPIFWPM